jgi:hypothetical protein
MLVVVCVLPLALAVVNFKWSFNNYKYQTLTFLYVLCLTDNGYVKRRIVVTFTLR